jgi:hypothetical protein
MAKINLGNRFYCMSKNGALSTSIVGEIFLWKDEVSYSLYGERPHKHFSTPEEALDSALVLTKRLLADVDSKSVEKCLQEQLSLYENERESVILKLMEQNLFQDKNMGSMNLIFHHTEPTFDSDAIPEDYLYPGTRVWGVVTPATHFMTTPRIFPGISYFILETVIKKITLVHYGAGLRYSTSGSRSVDPASRGNDLLCTSLEDAQVKMQDVFQAQTPGEITDITKIPVFTKEDVREAEKERTKAIMKSLEKSSQRERELGLTPDYS